MTRSLAALLLLSGCIYDSHVATSGDDAAVPLAGAGVDPSPSSVVLAVVAADLDGDGRDDLAVLELVAERAQPRVLPRLRLVYGRARLPAELDDGFDLALVGTPFDSRTSRDGVSVPVYVEGSLAAGDLDADGVSDLAVALAFEGDGVVHLLRGDPGRGAPSALDALPALRAEGEGSFGARVRVLGDLDGDGAEELSIEDRTGSVAWIRWSGGALADARLAPQLDLSGAALFGLGDVDGDGHDDVGVADAGRLAIHAGPIAAPLVLPLEGPPMAEVTDALAGLTPRHANAHRVGLGRALTVLWPQLGAPDQLRAYRLQPLEPTPRETARFDTASRVCVTGARGADVLLGCADAACVDPEVCQGRVHLLSASDLTVHDAWIGSSRGERLGGVVALGDLEGDGAVDAVFAGTTGPVRLVSGAALP